MPWKTAGMQNVDDEVLVDAVKNRSPIYDKDDKNHCNRDLVLKLWSEVAVEVGCDALLCKQRWTSIRDYFMRKYREERLISPVQKKRKRWYLYDRLLFLKAYIKMSDLESEEGLNGTDAVDSIDCSGKTGSGSSSSNGMVDSVVNGNSIAYDSADESEMAIPSPASHQSNQTRRQQTFPGSKRKREEELEATISSLIQPDEPAPKSEESYYKRRENDCDGCSIEAKMDAALTKIVKEPSYNHHDLFFKSLYPMISCFDNLETLQFRTEVLELVYKYLQRQQSTTSEESQRK